MELQIYSSEKHNRSNLRYVIFSLVTAGTLSASIFYKNRAGSILLFFLLGGYFYFSVKNSWPTKMKILDTGLQVGNKIFPRSSVAWFVLEFDPKAEKIKNIVIISGNTHTIHSIHDTDESLKNFISELSNYKPLLEKYDQTTREKVLRRFKI